MSKIKSIKTDAFRVPLLTVLTDSTHGTMSTFELITVRVTDEDGMEGLGYTYAINSGGGAFKMLIDDYLSSVLIGHEADEIEARWQDMWWKLHYAGRGGHATSAISAVDIALWDLKAKHAGLPLWKIFGGFNRKVPVYAGGVDLEFTTTELLKQADQFQELGFRAIKMKVGRESLCEDVKRVEEMRRHLGDDFPLMADANMKWTADKSITAARALKDFNLVWLEEPTIPDDINGQSRIVRDGGIPIASGENLHTLYEFQNLISANAVSYPEPDVCGCGGMTIFRKVAALAEANNLLLTSHGVHDLTVHLMAAAPNRTFMEIHAYSIDRFIEEPLKIEDGYALASNNAGHGVSFKWKELENYRF
ncbi:TPA: mandelate racemase/muconate lactonizing enzyme family protein [Klebsiella pneumoniae]